MYSVMEQKPNSSFLRRDKYYILCEDSMCSKCNRGPVGCCGNGISLKNTDFAIDFSSIDDVKRLLELGIFYLDKYMPSPYMIHTKQVELSEPITYSQKTYCSDVEECENDGCEDCENYDVIEEYTSEHACVFWTKSGCRLEASMRPFVCRTYYCGKPIRFNIKKKDNSVLDWSKEEYDVLRQLRKNITYTRKRISQKAYRRLNWEEIMKVL